MTPTDCPLCEVDLRGAEIPETDRELFGNATHFSQVIGVYDTGRDRTVAWRCPQCSGEWDRVTAPGGFRTSSVE